MSSFTAIGNIVGPDRDHYQRILNFESSQTRRINMSRMARYLGNRRYFYGEQENPREVRMPLGIRYAGAIAQKHAHYLWGQWDRDIVDWTVTPILERLGVSEGGSDDEIAAKISRCMYYLMRRADANDKLYKGALNAEIYGDAVFRARYKPELMGASFESILPEYYHAIWEPLDINETLECCIAYNLDRQTAAMKYGTLGNKNSMRMGTILDSGLAVIWEWWSKWEWMLVVDDQIIHHEINPYVGSPETAADGTTLFQKPGFLPFTHIPNLGLDGEYWGFGTTEAIHSLQDEINLRLADMGDIVNYHSHPITVLKNYWGKVRELLVAPDAVWDMGREGEVKYLQWDGPPPQVFEYITMLIQVMLETSNLTPIAFGRSQQSQSSGAGLQVEMLPITEVVRRKRSQWGPRLKNLASELITIEMLSLTPAGFEAKYGFSIEDLSRFELAPRFASILPRDRLQVVNEMTARLVNRSISILGSLEQLGEDDPQAEKDRILEDLRELAKIQLETVEQTALITAAAMPNRAGGKNADRAKGGSNTEANPE